VCSLMAARQFRQNGVQFALSLGDDGRLVVDVCIF
jgi:hypothetical protein